MVGVICNYSKDSHPNKSLEELERLLELAQKPADRLLKSSERYIRDIVRRLGQSTIDRLAEDYKSGIDTTEIMVTYQLSKSSVLKLLANRGVAMRHQAMTPEQTTRATRAYEEGVSLAAVASTLGIPRETIRRALLDAGVTLRKRGRPAR